MITAQDEKTLAERPFYAFGLTCLLLWPIGFEQFLPIVFALVYVLVFRRVKPKVYRTFHIKQSLQSSLIFLFIALMLVSLTGIAEFVRLFTFSRDLLAWVTAALLFMHFDAHFRRYDFYNARKPFDAAFWVIVLSCIIYVAIGSIKFPSLAYLVSPGFIKNSMTGTRFLLKDFGEQLYFYGFTDRVSSFFGSPIHLACIIILLLPFALTKRASMLGKLFVYITALAIVFFAQARAAIIILVAYPFLALAIRAILKPARSPFAVLASGMLLIFLLIGVGVYLNTLIDFFDELFFSRRAGSAEARSSIYLYSWQWLQERPIIGYGTQIDIPNLAYPLGSHSTPLGFAFKYGLPAAVIMCGLLSAAYVVAIQLFRLQQNRAQERFYGLIVTSLTCYFSLLVINEFVVDLYHHLFLFALLGALWGTKRRLRKSRQLSVSADQADAQLLRTATAAI